MLYMHCANCGKVMVVPVTRYRIYGAICVGLGVLAWRTYFFAGTGCAFELCCGLGIIGVLIFCFANTLACRSISHSCCPHCGQLNWRFGVPLPSNRNLPGRQVSADGAHSGLQSPSPRRPLPGSSQKLPPQKLNKQTRDNE